MRPLLPLLAVALLAPAAARAALDADAVLRLGSDDWDEKIAAVERLARQADPAAAGLLQALAEDELQVAGGRVLRLDGERYRDAVTGAEVQPAPEGAEPITVDNRVRGVIATALAALRLDDPDRVVRRDAARELASAASPALAPALGRALGRERDGEVKQLLALAYAQATLRSPEPAARLAAVRALRGSGGPAVEGLLAGLLRDGAEADPAVRREALVSLSAVRHRLAVGELVGRVFSGLSLGSILLLAALGLAVTYGLMGVINMAHGELLMVGAYATWGVQGIFARRWPAAAEWYVVAAVPVAFLSAALVGAVLERAVIRFLYGRPLETLLATWGASLILVQAARSVFGAQNVNVANPAWMSGGVQVMVNAVLPWNRIVIGVFSLLVLALVWLVMNRTRFGLFLRAVTQNRAMAGCVGVPTSRLDTLAFAAGAGVAGLGGVALSQIGNVGPEMGQGYIVDSFLVVVLGGVGQLAGAVWAALGLGVISKFLEGWSGAVIAKIAVLAFVVIFIQRRPQGLFALRGRFAED